MVIAIRIILALIASWLMFSNIFMRCYPWWDLFSFSKAWDLPCVVKFLAATIGIPLVIAFVAGHFKKSMAVFWNTFVGVLVVEAVVLYVYINYWVNPGLATPSP